MRLEPRIPPGPLPEKWDNCRLSCRLVSPARRRSRQVVVVGTGLAGAAAAAALGELGFCVKAFCLQDSPRRAHSIAAQGGINAAKNYRNDGDSIWRLFHDTVKGGDFRSREANVYRLAQLSNAIIDHCVALGVPFAREYGGGLANRSFGGAQVSRTFYARGQTGQQLLLGAHSSLMRQVAEGRVSVWPRREMMDLVVADGRAVGIVVRNLLSGRLERHAADAVVLASGGYGNVFHLSTNALSGSVSAAWRAHRRGAGFANPCFVQIHPTCIPVQGEHQSKLTLMSESLRNDGRVWVPKRKGDRRPPAEIPEAERDYYLERKYPRFGNLVPRDVASRNAKEVCDQGRGVGPTGRAVYLDFAEAIKRDGLAAILQKYGNLFHMYERIADVDPAREPMAIYPAVHYAMGGLWVDYHLQSTVEGLFVAGEANFSDHGANRLGASALMQGLADGYFVLPCTVGSHLAEAGTATPSLDHPGFAEAEEDVGRRLAQLLKNSGRKRAGAQTADHYRRRLGAILWDGCGIARSRAGLERAKALIPELREEFHANLLVPGSGMDLNQSLERAGRVADFLELAELMVMDALAREESCGCHLREESQTEDGEALRDDVGHAHVAVWEHRGEGQEPLLHKEPLFFEAMTPAQRSYR